MGKRSSTEAAREAKRLKQEAKQEPTKDEKPVKVAEEQNNIGEEQKIQREKRKLELKTVIDSEVSHIPISELNDKVEQIEDIEFKKVVGALFHNLVSQGRTITRNDWDVFHLNNLQLSGMN